MSNNKPQAIAGISSQRENTIMILWPSIACTGLGRLLGRLYESIPWKVWGLKISHILFALPTAPLALLIYILIKIAGERFVLTNRSLQKWTTLGSRMLGQVPLTDIEEILVVQSPGQVFYKAGDLQILDSRDETILVLEGVSRPFIFRHILLDTRNARRQVEASLETIKARQPATA